MVEQWHTDRPSGHPSGSEPEIDELDLLWGEIAALRAELGLG